MKNSLKVAGLLAAIALVTGCAAEVDSTEDTEPPLAPTALSQSLANGGIRFRVGACHGDGMVIKGGVVYRLGVPVGVDVTGISSAVESDGDAICHNQSVWQAAANYMCNMNSGGTLTGVVDEFDEYVEGALVQHPGGQKSGGLYFAYVDMQGPCNTPSQLDFMLDQIECCKAPPKP